MKYDNVDKFNLKNVGIAYIIEKKQFTKDEKTTTYYEIIDCAHGFAFQYSNSGLIFTSLSRNTGLELYLNHVPDQKYLAISFKTYSELSSTNNNTVDIKTFMEQRKRNIGNVYFYNDVEDTYNLIKDEEIIKIIENRKEKKKILMKMF